MTYLFINNQEIKNEIGNPISVSANTLANTSDNPIWTENALNNAASVTAFGEPLAINITPVIQLEAIYGLDPNKFEVYTASGGSVESVNSTILCHTGTSLYGYGVIRSKRSLRYRPGQGALSRFTAAFTTDGATQQGYAGYTQRAGLFSQENAIQIGFDGTKFGILRQDGGKATIYRLTINVGATTSSTVTLTLNNVVYNIPITSGSIQHNAREIGAASYPGWRVNSTDNEVIFLNTSVGPQAGTFNVTDNGATFDSTLTLARQGIAHTDNWVYQEDFSVDTLDGNGDSGAVIDFSKLNVYQINYKWLGVGELRFSVENPDNGDMVYFHHIHYSNRHIIPHLANPSMKIGYVAASLGGTGTDIHVRGASMMGGIEGIIAPTSFPDSASTQRTSGLVSGGISYHMMSLQNRIVLNDKINTKELVLQSISCAGSSAAGAPIKFIMYKNLPTNTYEYRYVNKNWSAATVSAAETVIDTTGSEPIFQFLVSPGSASIVSLHEYRIVIPAGDSISVAVIGSGVISQADVVLNWIED